ncbi:MAG: hypothetical protein R3F43_02055 [bacterium]
MRSWPTSSRRLREAGEIPPTWWRRSAISLERAGRWAPPLAEVAEGEDPAALAERPLAAVKKRLPPGDQSVFPVGCDGRQPHPGHGTCNAIC